MIKQKTFLSMALCGSCHGDKTGEDRHRRKQKKIKEAEREEKRRSSDPFGFSLGLKPQKRRSKSSINNFGKGIIDFTPSWEKKKRKKNKISF